MSDDYDFEVAKSGAAKSYPKQCSALRKSDHVLIKEHPCKIVDMSTSKTGKHGHAKVHLVGIDIFDGKKYEDICPSTHNMNVPNVVRTELSAIDIDDDNYLTVMDNKGDTRDDLKLDDEDILKTVKEGLERDGEIMVTVVKAMDREKILSAKKSSTKK